MKKTEKEIRFWYSNEELQEFLFECQTTAHTYQAEPGNGLPARQEVEVEILRCENERGITIDPLSYFTPQELNDIEYQAGQHHYYGGTMGFFSNELEAAEKYLSEKVDAEELAESILDDAKRGYENALYDTRQARIEVKRIKSIQREYETDQSKHSAR